MEVGKAIEERRTIRHFKKKNIQYDKMSEIMESFIYAPCAGNLQNWRLICVKNKGQLNEACFDQEPVIESNYLIVVCSDNDDLIRHYKKEGEFYAVQNTSAGIQNMLLKAHSMKIGSCWIGAFDKDEVKGVLKIPENIDIHAIIAFGYADEKPEMPLKSELRNIINFNEWGNNKKDKFPLFKK